MSFSHPNKVTPQRKICFWFLGPKVNHHQNIFATTRGAEHRAEGRPQRSRRPKAEAGPLPCSTSSAGLRPAEVDGDRRAASQPLLARRSAGLRPAKVDGFVGRCIFTRSLACFGGYPTLRVGAQPPRLGAVEWLPAFGLLAVGKHGQRSWPWGPRGQGRPVLACFGGYPKGCPATAARGRLTRIHGQLIILIEGCVLITSQSSSLREPRRAGRPNTARAEG